MNEGKEGRHEGGLDETTAEMKMEGRSETRTAGTMKVRGRVKAEELLIFRIAEYTI